MKLLFCEHPKQPLRKEGYCSYYGEIFYALKKECNISFVSKAPNRVSELGKGWDAIILGHAHTNTGDKPPVPLKQDTNIPLFPILNKEYTALNHKLNWIKTMNATAALTVHHDTKKYTELTNIPFYRFMWSCDEKIFKDYGDSYSYDLFYSGVIRTEQHNNLRNKIIQDLSRLKNYNLCINARHQKNNYCGKVYSSQEYAKKLCSSKIIFVTPSPANLVNPRYFECMASNRALALCSRVDDPSVYSDMIEEGKNCAMFSTVDEFFDKAIYYLEHDAERMKIVNQAYKHFTDSQTWKHRATHVLDIIKKHVNQ